MLVLNKKKIIIFILILITFFTTKVVAIEETNASLYENNYVEVLNSENNANEGENQVAENIVDEEVKKEVNALTALLGMFFLTIIVKIILAVLNEAGKIEKKYLILIKFIYLTIITIIMAFCIKNITIVLFLLAINLSLIRNQKFKKNDNLNSRDKTNLYNNTSSLKRSENQRKSK